MLNSVLVFATYFFLIAAICSLWLRARFPIWSLFFVASFLFGVISGVLSPAAIIPTILLVLAGYGLKHATVSNQNRLLIKIVAGCGVVLISLGLALHLFPGFHNYKTFSGIFLSPGAVPYTQHFSYDKAMAGLFLMAFFIPLARRGDQRRYALSRAFTTTLILVLVVMPIAWVIGYVGFAPKFPDSFFLWAVTNLFSTCVAEEAFFRGFFQRNLAEYLTRKVIYGQWFAFGIVSIVFGLAHFGGGLVYMGLAFIAGLGYGWIYLKTNRIEASIFTHFSFNLVHFTLFSYPSLT